MKNLKEFGIAVQEGRKNKNMTLCQLAEAVNVSKDTIEKIERGEYDIIIDEAFGIKLALDMPLSSLLHLFDKNDVEFFVKLKIIEYSEDLGADRVMDTIKLPENENKKDS